MSFNQIVIFFACFPFTSIYCSCNFKCFYASQVPPSYFIRSMSLCRRVSKKLQQIGIQKNWRQCQVGIIIFVDMTFLCKIKIPPSVCYQSIILVFKAIVQSNYNFKLLYDKNFLYTTLLILLFIIHERILCYRSINCDRKNDFTKYCAWFN